MNKKILIGSIIAVVILVLVSFTGVVGYQTTKSSTIARASPLFSVRSTRAIDRDSKDLTCDYVGKGEESILSIPKRDDITALFYKFVDMISEMDDETSEKLITFLINYAQKNKRLNDKNPNKIRETLYLLRDDNKSIPIFDTNIKRTYYFTWCEPICDFTYDNSIFCRITYDIPPRFCAIIAKIYELVYGLLYGLFYGIAGALFTILTWCEPIP